MKLDEKGTVREGWRTDSEGCFVRENCVTRISNYRIQLYIYNSQMIYVTLRWSLLLSKGKDTRSVHRVGDRRGTRTRTGRVRRNTREIPGRGVPSEGKEEGGDSEYYKSNTETF